jgi:hypothetical protein
MRTAPAHRSARTTCGPARAGLRSGPLLRRAATIGRTHKARAAEGYSDFRTTVRGRTSSAGTQRAVRSCIASNREGPTVSRRQMQRRIGETVRAADKGPAGSVSARGERDAGAGPGRAGFGRNLVPSGLQTSDHCTLNQPLRGSGRLDSSTPPPPAGAISRQLAQHGVRARSTRRTPPPSFRFRRRCRLLGPIDQGPPPQLDVEDLGRHSGVYPEQGQCRRVVGSAWNGSSWCGFRDHWSAGPPSCVARSLC